MQVIHFLFRFQFGDWAELASAFADSSYCVQRWISWNRICSGIDFEWKLLGFGISPIQIYLNISRPNIFI